MANRLEWAILPAVFLASAAWAAGPRPSLPEVPVADMRVVAPAEYGAAAALAAGGSSPLDIALKIVGEFQGATQHIIQVNEGSEAPSASRVTVVRDGLLDDSVRGVRWDIALEKTTAGVWKIVEAKRAWRCWRGGSTDRFAPVPCP